MYEDLIPKLKKCFKENFTGDEPGTEENIKKLKEFIDKFLVTYFTKLMVKNTAKAGLRVPTSVIESVLIRRQEEGGGDLTHMLREEMGKFANRISNN